MEKTNTRRSLYYYEIKFNPYKKFENVEHNYLRCLQHVNGLVKSKDRSRYYTKNESYVLFFGQLDFLPVKKFIKGKLYKVRKDIFPQVINMSNENITDLIAEEEQGILETTHFIIDYRNKQKAQLAIEYNHYGARISEFIKYFNYLGSLTKTVRRAIPISIVRDRLESIITRVNRVSNFEVKVHKDNISRIQEIDNGLGTAFYHAQNFSKSDYITINLNIDYKIKTDTDSIKSSINTWISIMRTKPTIAEYFERFRIKAEDEEHNNSLEEFDLLFDKEESKISVEKRKNSRVILSLDFFPKLIREYERKFK